MEQAAQRTVELAGEIAEDARTLEEKLVRKELRIQGAMGWALEYGRKRAHMDDRMHAAALANRKWRDELASARAALEAERLDRQATAEAVVEEVRALVEKLAEMQMDFASSFAECADKLAAAGRGAANEREAAIWNTAAIIVWAHAQARHGLEAPPPPPERRVA